MPSHVKPSKNLITWFEYFTVTFDSLTKTMFDRRDRRYKGWRGKGNEEGGRKGESPLVLHWNTGKICKVVEGMKEEFQSINFGWIGYGELGRVLVLPLNVKCTCQKFVAPRGRRNGSFERVISA